MPSEVYREFMADARTWCGSVEFWRAALFGYVMCRRLAPAYLEFLRRVPGGDPRLLDEAQRMAATWLVRGELDVADAAALVADLERSVPDSDDVPGSAAALDAVSVHVSLLQAIIGQSLEPLRHIQGIAYDRVDAAAGDALLPGGGALTPPLEADIARHPYVQQELAWQRLIFAELRSAPERDEQSIAAWLSRLPVPDENPRT